MTYTIGLENINLDGSNVVQKFVIDASESRARAIEAAIHRFMDCGVELARFSIEEWPLNQTMLCIDGVPRFGWQLVFEHPEKQTTPFA